jgi:hypothetical protein
MTNSAEYIIVEMRGSCEIELPEQHVSNPNYGNIYGSLPSPRFGKVGYPPVMLRLEFGQC